MPTTILTSHRRHMRWPLVTPDNPLFVISSDPNLIDAMRWTYTKRQKQTGWAYEIEPAELEGSQGVMVRAVAMDQAPRITDQAPRVVGESLRNWSAMEPGKAVAIPCTPSQLLGLRRSVRRWNQMNGNALMAQVRASNDGLVFEVYRRETPA